MIRSTLRWTALQIQNRTWDPIEHMHYMDEENAAQKVTGTVERQIQDTEPELLIPS